LKPHSAIHLKSFSSKGRLLQSIWKRLSRLKPLQRGSSCAEAAGKAGDLTGASAARRTLAGKRSARRKGRARKMVGRFRIPGVMVPPGIGVAREATHSNHWTDGKLEKSLEGRKSFSSWGGESGGIRGEGPRKVCPMSKVRLSHCLVWLLAVPAAHSQVSLVLEGALELRSGNVSYEEYFIAGEAGVGVKTERRLGTKAKGGEYLGVGGAYAFSRLEDRTATDQGEVWVRLETDPRSLFERKVRYEPFALWAFAETKFARDLVLGLREAANHFAGLGLAVRPLGGTWTFSFEQGLGQRSETLSSGARSDFFAGYGRVVNGFGKEGELRLVLSSTAYVEEGPGIPITENWTLRQASTLEVPIEGALFLTVTHSIDHRNRPVAGFSPTDQSLRTGLRMSL
jgi:hypothetical protein